MSKCCKIDIGMMHHRIAIQTLTDAQDALGGPTESWATLATVWASIEPFTGREYFQFDKTNGTTTHRIKVRYSSDIASMTPKDRITYSGRTFNISSIINLQEANEVLEIMAEEVL